jgi:hypothetical protein
MAIDLLELALPTLSDLETVTITTAWGPTETTLCSFAGTLIGQLSSGPFGLPHSIRSSLSGFHVIHLTPMLRPSSLWAPPPLPAFLDALGRVLSASSTWAVWCEPDVDQAPVREAVFTPEQLLQRLEVALQPGPLEGRSFLASHGLLGAEASRPVMPSSPAIPAVRLDGG